MAKTLSTTDQDQRRGRGATANPDGRFERHDRVAEADGWDIAEDLPPLRTEVAEERPRKVITRNQSPDIGFDRSLNPYRGCEHGCIYCYARPSHGYLGLSAGLDFETKLTAKPDAPACLARELGRKGYAAEPLALGTNTDPYQPIEAGRRITRSVLEVLADHGHPVTITTKGSLIERDIDILSDMAARDLVHVGISVTSLNPRVARAMEPRVPPPDRRLKVIERLAEAGIPVRVMVSPIVPALTDHEIETILEAAKKAGASAASWVMLRLPHEVAPLFEAWLAEHFPDRAARVMGRVRETRGGQVYDATFGTRHRGKGQHADLIAKRFQLAMARNGLSVRMPPLRRDLFTVPTRQLSLF